METFFPDDAPLKYWLSKASVAQIACSVSWPPVVAVTGYAPCVRAWSPTSRDEPEFKPVTQLLEVDGERFVAVAVKGDLLVAADASSSGSISVWDTATWTRQQTLTAGAPVTSLDASRTFIAAGTAAGYVRVWKRHSASDPTFTQFFVPDLQLDSLPVHTVRLGPMRQGPGGGGAGGGGGGGGGGGEKGEKGDKDGSDCIMVVHTRGNGRVSAWRLSDAKIIGTLGRGGGGAAEPSDALLSANALHTCLARGHLLIVSWLPGRDPLLQYVHPIQRAGGEIPGIKEHLAGLAKPLCADYDGDVVVMGCEDGLVWVWGLLRGYGQPPQHQPGTAAGEPPVSHWRRYHAGAVGAVACLPNRGQIASAGADGCVKLWSSSGELLAIARLGWQVTSMAVNELALVVGGAEGQVQLLVLLPAADDGTASVGGAASRPTEADRCAAAAAPPPAEVAQYDYWFDARTPKAAAATSNGGGGAGACGRVKEHPEAFNAFVPPRRGVSPADLQPPPRGSGGGSAGGGGGGSGGEGSDGSAGGATGAHAEATAAGVGGGKASSFNMQAALKGAHRSAADQAAAQAAEEEARRSQLRAMGEGPGVARSRGAVQLEGATAALGRKCSNPSCLQREGVAALQQQQGAGGFKRCGACKSVLYCSTHCQSTHWRDGHKKECARLAEARRQQLLQVQQEQEQQRASDGAASPADTANGGGAGALSPRAGAVGCELRGVSGGGEGAAAGVLSSSGGTEVRRVPDCLNELD